MEEKKKLRLGDKIILGVLIAVFLFAFYISLDANKYRALVHVVEGEGKVGVNPTDEALDFGDLSRGTSAVRRVAINNGTRLPFYVIAIKTGNIRSLMDLDQNYFRVAPKTEEKIEFITYIPASAEVGSDYTGRVYLFKIPIFF